MIDEKCLWYREHDPQRNLGNVLAILNGDGGHYEARWGTKAAIIRGIDRYYRERYDANKMARVQGIILGVFIGSLIMMLYSW